MAIGSAPHASALSNTWNVAAQDGVSKPELKSFIALVKNTEQSPEAWQKDLQWARGVLQFSQMGSKGEAEVAAKMMHAVEAKSTVIQTLETMDENWFGSEIMANLNMGESKADNVVYTILDTEDTGAVIEGLMRTKVGERSALNELVANLRGYPNALASFSDGIKEELADNPRLMKMVEVDLKKGFSVSNDATLQQNNWQALNIR